MMDHQDGLCATGQRSAAVTTSTPATRQQRCPTATASSQPNTAAVYVPHRQRVHQPAQRDTHPGRHCYGSLATPWNDAAQSGRRSPHPTHHDQSRHGSPHAHQASTRHGAAVSVVSSSHDDRRSGDPPTVGRSPPPQQPHQSSHRQPTPTTHNAPHVTGSSAEP